MFRQEARPTAVSSRPLFADYSPSPLNDAAVPPFPGRESDEEEDDARPSGAELDYERAPAAWGPISPAESPVDAPLRFVDGSIQSRTVASIVVGFQRRPLIAAVISAASLDLEGRALHRGPALRILKVLCLYANGIEEQHLLDARRALSAIGVKLLHSEAEVPQPDFDSLRRATRSIAMRAMEEAERHVLLADTATPTLVDGLLERRLAGQPQDLPFTGLVKRQMATYLPPGLQEVAYSLRPGERTPAFVLRTVQHVDLVNTYVRLSAQAGASPTYGIVRVTAPLAYVQRAHALDVSEYLSGLAAYLYRLRHRDLAYARAGISIEPIVRVEDHLHAVIPDIETLIPKLHRLLQTGPQGGKW